MHELQCIFKELTLVVVSKVSSSKSNAMRYKHMRKCEVGSNDATHELVAENHVITSKTKGKGIN